MSAVLQTESAVDRLHDALSDLSECEQDVLARMIAKAKFDENGRAEIDEVSIVREFMKSEGGYLQKFDFGDMPPMVKAYPGKPTMQLPKERLALDMSLKQVLAARRSRRDFRREALDLAVLGTLLESAYGVRHYIGAYETPRFPVRWAPSSGGLQSVEVYVVAHDVQGLPGGTYYYDAVASSLVQVDRGLMRRRSVRACLMQDWTGESAALLFLTCRLDKLLWKYGRRAYRMAHVDAGIVAEHLHLVATSLGLGSCMLAGFTEDEVHKLIDVDGKREFVALALCVGVPAVPMALAEAA